MYCTKVGKTKQSSFLLTLEEKFCLSRAYRTIDGTGLKRVTGEEEDRPIVFRDPSGMQEQGRQRKTWSYWEDMGERRGDRLEVVGTDGADSQSLQQTLRRKD
ncbi:hypothetical protein Trydic_g16994 [Trypoxylus dichotomus]